MQLRGQLFSIEELFAEISLARRLLRVVLLDLVFEKLGSFVQLALKEGAVGAGLSPQGLEALDEQSLALVVYLRVFVLKID